MFFDEVELELSGGAGGNGCVAFHREKFVHHGPPDGGDGGKGGSIVLRANENINTFKKFSGVKHFKAPKGGDGKKNNMHGRDGEELVLEVPVGTLVYIGEDLKCDLKEHGDSYVAATGGRGGFGNAHFMSSTRQAPKFAELGDRGEHIEVRLEIQLIADVGLVGFPSAGKSTLISHVSAAKPKIGAYPFTTIIPNLGVVHLSRFKPGADGGFVIADMPGIIEGAAEGKGLGDTFLKHISRSAILVYVLDPFSYDGRSLVDQFEILKKELKNYRIDLSNKPYRVAINKVDAIAPEERNEMFKEFFEAYPDETVVQISAASGESLGELMFDLFKEVQASSEHEEVEAPEESSIEYIPRELIDDHAFEVKKLYDIEIAEFRGPVLHQLIGDEAKKTRQLFTVHGIRIEQISRMTNTDQIEGIQRVYDVMDKMGIIKELRRAGAVLGDLVKLGPHIYEFHDMT